MLLVLPNATFGRTGSRRRKTKALEQHGALLINLLYLELSLYKYLTSLTVAVSNYLSRKFETNVFQSGKKTKNWIELCFFSFSWFWRRELGHAECSFLSENGGKGFVKLGCNEQLRRSKASETKCGNGRIMGCQQFLMQSFKTWINIRWWKQSFCHINRKIFLFFLAALSSKIHPARLVFDRCWAEVFLSLRVSIRVHEVILESGGVFFLSPRQHVCIWCVSSNPFSRPLRRGINSLKSDGGIRPLL